MRETLPDGAMSIVLTWRGDEDFDAHLEIPGQDSTNEDSNSSDKSHLWYGVDNSTAAVTFTGVSTNDYHIYTDIVSSGDYVTLDQDNVDGIVATCTAGINNDRCGPETITISKVRSSGTYRFHVHAFDPVSYTHLTLPTKA